MLASKRKCQAMACLFGQKRVEIKCEFIWGLELKRGGDDWILALLEGCQSGRQWLIQAIAFCGCFLEIHLLIVQRSDPSRDVHLVQCLTFLSWQIFHGIYSSPARLLLLSVQNLTSPQGSYIFISLDDLLLCSCRFSIDFSFIVNDYVLGSDAYYHLFQVLEHLPKETGPSWMSWIWRLRRQRGSGRVKLRS